MPTFHPSDSVTDDAGYNEGCMDDNVFGIQYANARLFVDGLYPNPADRDVLRNNVAQFVTLILDSFQVGLEKFLLIKLLYHFPIQLFNFLNIEVL